VRNAIIPTGVGISLALLLGVAGASAQPSPAPKSPAASPPVESVTVTGASSEAVNHFVQGAATPTHIIGKVARWETPICPAAVGLPEDETALVVKRVKEVAAQIGVRVSTNPVCHPNIVIAFTRTPQALLDNIRKDNKEWLGYYSSPEELERLGTMTRPIQAWYSTATVDLNGRRQIDSAQITGRGLKIVAPCSIMTQATPGAPRAGDLCTFSLPNAIKAEVKGSKLTDGLQAAFDHIVIIANPRMMHSTVSTVADYIAVLALAQINSLDTCQALPSITSLLAPGCARAATEITENDMNYLKAVYAANPDKLPELQKNEIAYRMEQGIEGH
jgi:hypothetical protein